jgi:lipopolysaccharide export system protein LptA
MSAVGRMLWLIGLAAWGPAAGAAADEKKPAAAERAAKEPAGPVSIESDELKVRQKQRTAVFSGNVRAVQGELTIRCRTLTVHYAERERGAGTSGDVRSMVFSGDVRIVQGDRRGHCERAEYDRPAGRIVCTGEPWVVEGDNRIRGQRIVYLLGRDEVRISQPRAVLELESSERGRERREAAP